MSNSTQWLIHALKLLGRISYKAGWMLCLRVDEKRAGAVYLQWEITTRCAKTGAIEVQKCRKWYLSEFMIDGELVQTALKAALTAEEHECREHFRFDGKAIFGPHISLDALLSVCEREERRA